MLRLRDPGTGIAGPKYGISCRGLAPRALPPAPGWADRPVFGGSCTPKALIDIKAQIWRFSTGDAMTTSTARVGAIFKEQVRSGPPLRRPTALRTKTTGNNLQIGGEHGEGRGKARTIHGPTQSHSRRRERKDREEHDTKNKVDRRAGLHLSQPKEEARRAPKITKLLSQKDTSLGNRKPEACRTSNAHQHDPGPRPSSEQKAPEMAILGHLRATVQTHRQV